MQELWSSASYEPHLLSLPLAFAPVAMLVVVSYALVMRGEPVLRGWLLVHYLALLPYSILMMLSPSIRSRDAAELLFRFAAAFIPLAAAAGGGFQYRMLGMHRQARWFVWLGVVVALAWIVVGAFTSEVIEGVRWLRFGLWYANAGPLAAVALASTVVLATPGFVLLARAALRDPPSPQRRQLRLVLAANVVTYSGLTDVALAYDMHVFPLGWLLSGAGSLLVARALVVEDLLRVRAVDTTAPRVVLHMAGAILIGGVALGQVGPDAPWWLALLVLSISFVSVRVAFAAIGLVNRGARGAESTLDRLLGQLVARARPLDAAPAIANLAADVVELGVGVRVKVLLAAADDYGWATTSDDKLADDDAPDPLLGAWLAEHRQVAFSAELDLVPEDLRAALAGLLERNAARALVPVVSQDELVAIVMLPASSRRLGSRELAFVVRACERLAEALVHARMAQRAAERAMIARQVELAATVQRQLLPTKGPHVHGALTVVGSWLPASECAGDFWGVYSLGARGVLIAIGDVTGHGVASATVTAAASAAVEVAVRRAGEALVLDELVASVDAAVRSVGGGQLMMTCFAAILDAQAHEVRYVSCGHPTPYLCRSGAHGELELSALVGRGNPLGSGAVPGSKVQHRPLQAGDLVVWYTDGVIEAEAPEGEPFGDRRLQRMLRRLDRAHLSPLAVHDVIHAAVAAHRAGRPRGDDETLVVAQWAPAREATEAAP